MKYIVPFCLIIGSLISLVSKGTTYYISPSGNDSASGTSVSTAWRTIARVNAGDFKGDTVLFMGGNTFFGSLYFTNADVGTATKPVVVGSYGTGKATINSDTLFGVYVYNAAGFVIKNLIFTGVSRLVNKHAGIAFYMDMPNVRLPYIKIENVEVYEYKNSGISIGSWTTAGGFKDVTITNCIAHDNGEAGISTFAMQPYVHRNVYVGYCMAYNNPGIAERTSGSSGSGIILGGVDVAVVEYCTSYNNGWLHNTPDGGPVGIWAHASDSVTFQFNESHHNKSGTIKDGGGFDFDGGCTNSVMQYNYSHDNYGAGYLLAQYEGASVMKTITIRYNISENDGRKGDQGSVHLWAASNSGGIQTVKIYNNTVFVKPITEATPKGFYIRSGPVSDVKLRNNIWQTTGGVPLIQVPYNVTACTMQGNSYWPSGGAFKIIWGATTYTSLSAWRTATGQEKVNGVASGIQADALFADTTTGVTFNDATKLANLKRYKLKSTSTLINKGLDLKTLFSINVGNRDFWGNSLVNKTKFHIGAFQGTAVTSSLQSGIINIMTRQSNNIYSDGWSGSATMNRFGENSLQVWTDAGHRNLVVNFSLAKAGKATVVLYNGQGQLIKNIFSGNVSTGDNKQINVNTGHLASGVYFVGLLVEGEVITQKVFLNN